MLRLLVLLLLLANGVYYAWSEGLLKGYGFAPAQQSEPARMTGQIRPETLTVVSTGGAPAADVAAAPPAAPSAECVQAGPFDEAQTTALRQVLETAMPVGVWRLDATPEPARWIVYMGKFPDAQAVAAKRTQLASLSLKVEPLTNASLEPGISLGGYETRGGAEARLEALQTRGVRTARVIEEHPATRNAWLRITAAEDVLNARLDELKPAMAGKPLRPCK